MQELEEFDAVEVARQAAIEGRDPEWIVKCPLLATLVEAELEGAREWVRRTARRALRKAVKQADGHFPHKPTRSNSWLKMHGGQVQIISSRPNESGYWVMNATTVSEEEFRCWEAWAAGNPVMGWSATQ